MTSKYRILIHDNRIVYCPNSIHLISGNGMYIITSIRLETLSNSAWDRDCTVGLF